MEESARQNKLGLAASLVLLAAVLVGIAALLGLFDGEALSKREFVKRADQICRDAHARFKDLQRTPPVTARQAADLTSALIDTANSEMHRIDDLAAPDQLQSVLERYHASRGEAIKVLEKGRDAADQALDRIEKGDSQVDDLTFAYDRAQAELASTQPGRQGTAHRIGLRECSKPLVSKAALGRAAQPPTQANPGARNEVHNPPGFFSSD